MKSFLDRERIELDRHKNFLDRDLCTPSPRSLISISIQEVRIDPAQVDFDPRSHVGPAQFELDQDTCGSQGFHIDPSRPKSQSSRSKKFETETSSWIDSTLGSICGSWSSSNWAGPTWLLGSKSTWAESIRTYQTSWTRSRSRSKKFLCRSSSIRSRSRKLLMLI